MYPSYWCHLDVCTLCGFVTLTLTWVYLHNNQDNHGWWSTADCSQPHPLHSPHYDLEEQYAENRPKRCQMCHLDIRWVHFFSLQVFLLLTNLLQYLYVINYEICYREWGGGWQWRKWAKMMPDASFWLYISLLLFLLIFLDIYWCIIDYLACNMCNTLWIVRWKVEARKTGQNDARCIFWP